jgi:hypothetical protein
MTTPGRPENEGGKSKDPQTFSQDVQFSNLSARVPEKVARGAFATGVLILQGATEFVLDFVLRMNKPHQVVARVVLPMNLVPQLIDALKGNLEQYRRTYGHAPPALPTPPQPATQPSIEDIYQDLKLSEDVMVGAYANAVMIVHTPAEFCLEFISNFYPRSVITARVLLSAPQAPVLLNSLTQSWQKWQAKTQHPPHPPAPPPQEN